MDCNPRKRGRPHKTPVVDNLVSSESVPQLGFTTNLINNDVIGVLTGVENKAQVMTENGSTEIRNIYIEDDRQNEVKATLWGEAANYVTEADTKETEGNKIIVITSTRVARYQDEYQLKSTYGTKIYINLDIPEAMQLLERMPTPRTVHQLENNTQQQTEDDMLANMKTLLELTQMEQTDQKQTYTCQGVISGVRTDVEWRYISCPTCRKGLDADNICPKCVEEIAYPTQRYRILATLDDGKTEASIVMFDKEAEKVIGKPIAKVLEIYEKEKGKEKVFNLLQNCVGKRYTFKVMIGSTYYGDTRELKVVKTYLTEQESEEVKDTANKNTNEKATKNNMESEAQRDHNRKKTEENNMSQTTMKPMEKEWETNKRQRTQTGNPNENNKEDTKNAIDKNKKGRSNTTTEDTEEKEADGE